MAKFMEENLSEYEIAQMKNQKILDDLLNKELGKLNMVDAFSQLKSINNTRTKPKVKTGGNRRGDSTFRFCGCIPMERRSSNRLAKIAPAYNIQDADDELEKFPENGRRTRRRNGDDLDFEYLTEIDVNYQIKKKKSSTRSHATPVTMSVEEVTPSYLSRVSYKVSEKTYSERGTSCHQCRQKTLDSKTVCRNPNCIGVRGQFCGVCLRNRYGENATDALLDPGWSCPPCREICNCSICRSRKGKMPTGILANIVKKSGHTNAKDFLISLKDHEDPNLEIEPSESTNNNLVIDEIDDVELKKRLSELNMLSKSTIINEAKKLCHFEEDIENPVLGFEESGKVIYIGTSSTTDGFLGFRTCLPLYKTNY